MSEWFDVFTAPKDGTPILIWDALSMWDRIGCHVVVARWHGDDWQLLDSATADEYPGNGPIRPAHWMPLPKPPS